LINVNNFFIGIFQKSPKNKNHIEENLKKKLKKIITTDIEFQNFKEEYNKEMEQKLVNQVIEKRNKTFYYNIVENKNELNRGLTNLTPSLNPHIPNYSAMPHDHIHPQHFLKDPKATHDNKLKYLAYFDIIIDQHIRHVRPNQLHDNKFKFVKKQYIPDIFEDNDIASNMFIEHKFSLESEYYVKANKAMADEMGQNEVEEDDPVRYINYIFYL